MQVSKWGSDNRGFGFVGILIVVAVIAAVGFAAVKLELPALQLAPTEDQKSVIDTANELKEEVGKKVDENIIKNSTQSDVVDFTLSAPSERWLGGKARHEAPGLLAIPNAWPTERVLVLAGDNDHTVLLAVDGSLYFLNTDTFSLVSLEIPEQKDKNYIQFDAVYAQKNFFIGVVQPGGMYDRGGISHIYRFDVENKKLHAVGVGSFGNLLTDGTNVYATTEYIEFPGSRGLGFRFIPTVFADGLWYVWDKQTDTFTETQRPRNVDFGFHAGTDSLNWYVVQTAKRFVKEDLNSALIPRLQSDLATALQSDGFMSGRHSFVYFEEFAILYIEHTLIKISL